MRTRLFALSLATLLLLPACTKKSAVPAPPTPEQIETVKLELEEKAAAGDKNAQFELGALYHDGEGMPQDFAKAKSWFEKAAKQGEVRAQFNLGVMYYQGEGLEQDYAQAKAWFDKAAALNNPRAQFNLGVMYYRGEGVKQDFAKATELFNRAALQNFGEAQFNLAVMYLKGEGLAEPDFVKGYAWLLVLTRQGDKKASDVVPLLEQQLSAEQIKAGEKMADDLEKRIVKGPI